MKVVAAQLAIRKKLAETFVESQLKNPSFSLRAFSRKLSISPSALSEILNGKRNISKKLAERLLQNLCLSPKEIYGYLNLFIERQPRDGLDFDYHSPYVELTTDQFHVISEWYHFAILSLAETDDFQSDPKWISERLNIRLQDVSLAIERLERLGLIERDLRGCLKPTGAGYSTPDEVKNMALREGHVQNLEMARQSLEEDHVEVRDFTATTMAVDPAKIPLAKKLIREFHDKLCSFLESGPKTSVYKICIQMFPLTYEKERSHEKTNS